MVSFEPVSYSGKGAIRKDEKCRFQVTISHPLPTSEYQSPFILIDELDEHKISQRLQHLKQSKLILRDQIISFFRRVLRNPVLRRTLRYESDDFFHLQDYLTIKKLTETVNTFKPMINS